MNREQYDDMQANDKRIEAEKDAAKDRAFRRERIATHLLAGKLACPSSDSNTRDANVNIALKYTDALIARLDGEPEEL